MTSNRSCESGRYARDDYPTIEDWSVVEIIVRRASLCEEALYIACKKSRSPYDFGRIMTQKKLIVHNLHPSRKSRVDVAVIHRRQKVPSGVRFAVIARRETDDGAANSMHKASGSPARGAIRQR
ncbi:hypothetical protein [Methylosinus sp. sav-2]|uniref:hypothetical protein n=1 Tax=Methylosinus sp. sav-2 TaxID=2485168 RepID=UPI000A81B4D7|nr:hypothetical protein [Methylosinus sp. sav-2]